MLKKLIKILSYIPNEKGIYLGDDVFLTGRELDGSDKVYGFINDDGLKIVTRASIYPINDMDKADLEYIFNLSKLGKKIEDKHYPLLNADSI